MTGTVTAADPALKGRFFLQDFSGGVFVDNSNGPRPEPGEIVRVTGVSEAGAYAPVITGPAVAKLGKGPLPAAKVISIDRLMSGAEDSQRIETSGTVRAARIDGQRLAADVVFGGYRFRVYGPIPPGIDPQKLIGAQVRVRGTAAESHNRSLRQMVSAEVYVPVLSDFIVEKPESSDPFEQPILTLNSLAQYRRDSSLNDRVHVKGVVTLQREGESVFLHDPTGGLRVDSPQTGGIAVGDVVEASGFPSFENYLPVLQDAVLKKTQEAPAPVAPKPVSLEDVQQGRCHSDYVSLQGKVIDRTVRRVRATSARRTVSRTTLVLQNTNFLFTAEADDSSQKLEATLAPIGSTVEVRGICFTEIESDGRVQSFRILLGNPKDVIILRQPSWLTPQRLLIGLGILCAVLVVAVSWTVMVSKKNSVLKFLIREREKAQFELQKAHDLLEERVVERTEQLKFQITARKEAEVQSRAVLSERTRLAQELHDTLEQSLTGIALQLDTSGKLFHSNQDGAAHHLKLARNLIRQSQEEVRRSIWDLRCRALEAFDLPGALLRSARQMTHGTGIHVSLESRGKPSLMAEVVEENLLRIGQEALTNIIKHSQATSAKIDLEFGERQVVLNVADDGCGFEVNGSANAGNGHFGLLGMSERAKRLGGSVSISSARGKGTSVQVIIPLPGANVSKSGDVANHKEIHEERSKNPDSHC